MADLGWTAAVDWEELDPAAWPEVELDHLPALERWRALEVLSRLDLVEVSSAAAARIRLWLRGRRSDAAMAATPLPYARAPRWVLSLLAASAARPDPLGPLADPELLRAAEAVRDLAANRVDAHVALRALLAGEPSPEQGGWRRPGAPAG